jgi:hypothetical protein
MAMTVYQQGLQNCSEKDGKIIRDRFNTLNSGRQRSAANTQIIDVNDSPFFVQVAERLAAEFVASPPLIPAAQIGGDDSLDAGLAEMTPLYKSIF